MNEQENWVEVEISEIALISTGNTPSKKQPENYGGNIPFIKPPELKNNRVFDASEYISEIGAKKARILPKNSVLISCIGNLGKVGIAKEEVAFNQQINAASVFSGINEKLIFYQAQSSSFKGQLEQRASATTISIVNKGNFSTIKIWIPPTNEQNRIVSKIEELFSELDKGIESLKTAREQLKVYRQALLKHAFEGKLTEQWRKDNAAKLETADQLLERIKQEREDRYQQQLDDWKEAVKQWEASGKEGKKPVKPKLISKNDDNYQDISIYSSLPNEWRWVQIIDLLDSKPLNGRSVKDKDGGFRVLRLTSLKSKYIDVNESKEGDWTRDEAKRYLIKRGDFLLSRGNGSIKLVGRGALVKDNYEVAYPDTIVRLSISKGAYLTELFGYFWNSEIFRKQISSSARTTAGIYKINQALISDYYFPLIPLSEQEVLYEILEQHLSLIEVFEKNIIDDIDRSELLRQSILKKAFSGKLVPQDPNDEPASELLKRIAKEKAELEAQEKAAKAAIKKENPPQSPFTPRAPSKKGGG